MTSPSSLYSQETDTSHTYLLFKAQETKLKNTHTHTNKTLFNYIQVTLLVNEKKKKHSSLLSLIIFFFAVVFVICYLEYIWADGIQLLHAIIFFCTKLLL